jgi:deoxyadenosine/deoxycytidine kinase
LQRYQQQQELRQVDMFHNLLIADYMFVKDRLFASLNLDEKEMSLYDTVANLLEKNVINPDLVIYLQADTDTLMRNIAGRGREMEKNISEEYIDALNQLYTEYFFRYQDTPLVIINTNNIDFVNNQQDLDEVINYIRQPVTGTKFFNPVSP